MIDAATVTVGIQGERGAFSEIAARQMLGKDVTIVLFPSFPKLFNGLEKGEITHAVIPMENSLVGSVHENYDLLLRYEYPVLEETQVQVIHHLITHPGASLGEIRHVYSHPMAILQCRKFLEEYELQVNAIPAYDTAGSVKMIMEQDLKMSAAIASSAAAAIYAAKIIVHDIGDSRENYTRFFLVGDQGAAERLDSGNKTSIVFGVKNEPGALVGCLNFLSAVDIDMVKIESRPTRNKPWEYLFYVDLMGNAMAQPVALALTRIEEYSLFFRVLGCYASSIVR